jgi:hypothetical protein
MSNTEPDLLQNLLQPARLTHAAMNQLLEADIVYARNFMGPADMTVEQLSP